MDALAGTSIPDVELWTRRQNGILIVAVLLPAGAGCTVAGPDFVGLVEDATVNDEDKLVVEEDGEGGW
ncbi:MAG: hypothetical protein ACREBS_03475 [Nitrososphaerales archaeon]